MMCTYVYTYVSIHVTSAKTPPCVVYSNNKNKLDPMGGVG